MALAWWERFPGPGVWRWGKTAIALGANGSHIIGLKLVGGPGLGSIMEPDFAMLLTNINQPGAGSGK